MQGLYAVFRKELADHFSSYRFVILFALIAMVSFITSYMAGVNLKEDLEGLSNVKFPFLMLFSTPGALFSMVQFVSFFGPLIGIVLAFDSINRERAHGTLIKLVSQPIYRDAVINGKFLAGVTTVAIMLLAVVLVISGFGLAIVGIVPGIEEIWRLGIYLIISIFYISFWLGISILFSIIFKGIATSALASVALWIFLSFFISLGAEVVGNAIVPIQSDEKNPEIILENVRLKKNFSLLSPMILYSEATGTIVDPMQKPSRSALPGPMEKILSSRFQNPLPLLQSVLVVFPHIIALIAVTMISFALSYFIFMIQEIRR
jgi:ABC-2 type transport system permease protein